MTDESEPSGTIAVTKPAPVALVAQRIESIDVLRGVAVLGILVMNIPVFALLPAAFFNPPADGGFTGVNYIAWALSHTFFDSKMMSIFSMLFGAGIIIFTSRAEACGARIAALYYRRMFALIVMGLAHAYLLWEGDILFLYAVCGFLLYFVRRWPTRRLIVVGTVVVMVGVIMNVLTGLSFHEMESAAKEALRAEAAGAALTETQQQQIDAWRYTRGGITGDPEENQRALDAYLGSYGELFVHRAPVSFWMQTMLLVIWGLWRAGGLMMIGMGLFKLGFFAASLPTQTYARSALVGYGIGIPVVCWGASRMIDGGFDVVRLFMIDLQFNYIGSVLIVLAHASVVMWICRAGALKSIRRGLAAVGQMALTNYLMQSLICATIFFGWGFGNFSKLDRAELLAIVVAIWLIQFAWSPWWLSRYRFGPVEWAWRSVTYGKLQPFLRQPSLTPTRAT